LLNVRQNISALKVKTVQVRPLVVTVPENVDAIHSMIAADWGISASKIAETLEIHSGTCRIHHVLDKRKLSAKWVPKCLNANQKRGIVAPKAILEHSRLNMVGFLARLMTMDKTWIHLYDPETKKKSNYWRHSGSPRPQKVQTHKSASKLMVSVF
jgi:hypothetical protein